MVKLRFVKSQRMHMTDLINNRSAQEINELIQKYASVLEVSGIRTLPDVQKFAIIIDVAVNYIKDWHNDLTTDWKAWSIMVIKNQYHNKKINSESDVIQTINDFVMSWKENYKTYCNNLGIYASEYDRDRGFVYDYLTKKNR